MQALNLDYNKLMKQEIILEEIKHNDLISKKHKKVM